MIATLAGVITEKGLDWVVVEVRGVGYGVFVSNEDLVNLALDNEAKLHIHEHIREASHDLFGFTRADTKKLFEKLLEVNGVGPKMALNMLSIGSADKLKQAIAEGDIDFIKQASGVGRRVAERVVVDLKDKVGLVSAGDATGFLRGAGEEDEAVQALMGLGFTNIEAGQALRGIDKNLAVEEKVKRALKGRS